MLEINKLKMHVRCLVLLLFAILAIITSTVANAADPLGSTTNPAFSAKQIKTYSPSSLSGIYVFEVDGVGGLSPFAAYADMTTGGGGWTMVHDRTSINPDMDSFWQPVLNSYGPMQLRISTWTGLDAYFNFSPSSSNTPFSFIANSNAWTYFSGNPGMVNNPFPLPTYSLSQIMTDASLKANYTVYVKELNTRAYVAPVAPVPEPETFAMLLVGLGFLGGMVRRRRNDTK